MKKQFQRIAMAVFFFSGITFSSVSFGNTLEVNATELLTQCFPQASDQTHHSNVEIEIAFKNAPSQKHELSRVENREMLYLYSHTHDDKRLLLDKSSYKNWIYDVKNKKHKDATNTPDWLKSELLLNPAELKTFELEISAHDSFGGQDYYSINAIAKEKNSYPKRLLSLKKTQDQGCYLIRAAYFDNDKKLHKRYFSNGNHWHKQEY